jgi:hypothetical protein
MQGSGGTAPPFLTLPLDGRGLSASCPGHLTPEEIALSTHWIGNWVDPRVGLNTVEKRKSCPCWELNPSHPAHSYTISLQQKENVNPDSCFNSNHTKSRYKFWKAEDFLFYM